MTPLQKEILRSFGIFCSSILSGLVVYQTPPESWTQFGEWMWQPMMQGGIMVLAGLGIYKGKTPAA